MSAFGDSNGARPPLDPKIIEMYTWLLNLDTSTNVRMKLYDLHCSYCLREANYGLNLQKCGHGLCPGCLQVALFHRPEPDMIDCPVIGCDVRFSRYEIKVITNNLSMEVELSKAIKKLHRILSRAVRCRSGKCGGWLIPEEPNSDFFCDVCRSWNFDENNVERVMNSGVFRAFEQLKEFLPVYSVAGDPSPQQFLRFVRNGAIAMSGREADGSNQVAVMNHSSNVESVRYTANTEQTLSLAEVSNTSTGASSSSPASSSTSLQPSTSSEVSSSSDATLYPEIPITLSALEMYRNILDAYFQNNIENDSSNNTDGNNNIASSDNGTSRQIKLKGLGKKTKKDN